MNNLKWSPFIIMHNDSMKIPYIFSHNLFPDLNIVTTCKFSICLRNNSWKPYVYIVFTTGRPLCHEVLPRALARSKKLT